MNNKGLFDKYTKKISSLKDKNFSTLNNNLFSSKNNLLRASIRGSSKFDPSWIDTIEDCLYSLGQIVTNPREATKDEGNIVPIELAKKVNGESVQHLASHSQFIKEINEEGEVIPAKILSHSNKVDLHTYENRFIATFIRRLVLFVEKRYEFIEKNVNLEINDVLMVKNSSIINGEEVEIETKVKVKKESNDDVSNLAKDYIKRVESMRDYLSYYYTSPFMKEMKTDKDVRKPIIQTNILRKNPLYHKCYETFVFIERFDSLGVSYKIDRQYYKYTEEDREKLTYLLSGAYLAVQAEDEYEMIHEASKVYKPKILSSMDDEEFTYGKLLEGPLEFVRIDEKYKEYLKSAAEIELPLHPSHAEKEYYSKEYERKHALLERLKQIDQLIHRTDKEIALWEKELVKIIKRRDEEEMMETEKKLEELDNYRASLLEERRKAIIASAKEEASKLKAKKKIKEKEKVVEEHIEESNVEASFIVKTNEGYYVNHNEFSTNKLLAHVFNELEEANQIKNLYNGKVIKL